MAAAVIVSLVGGAGMVLFRSLDGASSGPEDAVRGFFDALDARNCEDAGERLTRQSLAWLAEERTREGFDDDAGHAQFVQECEGTIVDEQDGAEVVSTRTRSDGGPFATVRVVLRRPGGAEQSSEIDLVDEPNGGWRIDLSSLDEVLGMPELATIPEPVDAVDLPPRTPHIPRSPRRR